MGRFALGVALVAAFGAGCTRRVSEPLPVGPDTYTTSAHVTLGSTTRAREAVLKAAGALAKQLLVVNISDHAVGPNDATADVTFRCLAAGDPELRRPNFQQSPNVGIQDQR